MELQEKYTFELKTSIEHPELVEWLNSIPEADLPQKIENALLAGNFILELVQASSGEEQMKKFFSPVLTKMDDLNLMISTLLGNAPKSQKLGELGELIVEKQLSNAFPTDSFEILSQEGHQADLHARGW